MDKGYAIIPGPSTGFVELSTATAPPRAQGRVFRKQILKYGDLRYKGQKVKIDEEFADTLVRNFQNKDVTDIVHVPKAGPRNEHNDDPDRNVGEVIDVLKMDDGVYVDIDARTDDADRLGKTLLGASALLHLDYENRNTGEHVGPTLLHTCITNRPHVTGLEGFKEVLSLSADGADITSEAVVLTADDDDQEVTMTKEEWIAQGAEFGIDVAALTAKADLGVALSDKIQTTFGTTDLLALSDSDEGPSQDALVDAIDGAGTRIVELSAKIKEDEEAARKARGEARVKELLLTGYLLPKEKDDRLKLFLTDEALFESMVPEKQVVNLSAEEGSEPIDDTPEKTIQSEIDRYMELSESVSAAV